jgi:hypothetical protein
MKELDTARARRQETRTDDEGAGGPAAALGAEHGVAAQVHRPVLRVLRLLRGQAPMVASGTGSSLLVPGSGTHRYFGRQLVQ